MGAFFSQILRVRVVITVAQPDRYSTTISKCEVKGTESVGSQPQAGTGRGTSCQDGSSHPEHSRGPRAGTTARRTRPAPASVFYSSSVSTVSESSLSEEIKTNFVSTSIIISAESAQWAEQERLFLFSLGPSAGNWSKAWLACLLLPFSPPSILFFLPCSLRFSPSPPLFSFYPSHLLPTLILNCGAGKA